MESNTNSMEQQPMMSSPFSRWSDSHNRPPQSQWLHSTLAEVDEKIKTILELVEDNGDTFAMRAEMYYKKRPQLIKMVQDLHKSYSALADKYDHLKSASNNGSLSNSLRTLKGKRPQHDEYVSIEPPNFSSDDHESIEDDQFESLKNFISIDDYKLIMNKEDGNDCDDKNESVIGLRMQERDMNVWDEQQMKLSKLLEENLSKQAELIRRNEEKREMIKGLRKENRILSQKCSSNNYRMKSWKRQLRRLFCLT
ncbi:hypothetical protein CDL12_27781 [Handroanthus impetiginosus]|uniref:NAB domain-containing protein n=1 Tax=Handroanthus impetiginosus TaxID=429701 RepID=A0A2G9G3G0_9LAMI|nr:hypothetical protein CDL12_27781 [Handroanthus impetiginosus]